MYKGIIKDLCASLGDGVMLYSLQLGEQLIPLNPLIGSQITVTFEGERRCVHCNRKSNKLFNSGYCWPCFQNLAQNDMCQVKPHLCHYETCREQAWGDAHCMIPTYVYLAKSSDIKVGITRNVPGRWMDQGAVEAVPIALVPTRKMAGELELFLSQHMPDKTNWRKMLKGEVVETSLLEAREKVLGMIPEEYRGYLLSSEDLRTFQYPVNEYPEKIASHDLEKGPAEGKLLGIKGSYLILSTGVLNVPKFTGFSVSVQAEFASEAAAG
ncbi:MAG TPA: DUF2797 domain-containing protein [Symbiobacteriaceae bacterium]|nr:DUF2797 domain-containing protein [Symbiobacteriaceae bacterium]